MSINAPPVTVLHGPLFCSAGRSPQFAMRLRISVNSRHPLRTTCQFTQLVWRSDQLRSSSRFIHSRACSYGPASMSPRGSTKRDKSCSNLQDSSKPAFRYGRYQVSRPAAEAVGEVFAELLVLPRQVLKVTLATLPPVPTDDVRKAVRVRAELAPARREISRFLETEKLTLGTLPHGS